MHPRGFDAYTKSIGVDKYYGKEDYPNQDHYDGHWGIYDHYFFNYFSDYLSKTKKPFFTTLFTLSSHQPYSIPQEFQKNFPKGDLEIHESIGYADESIKLFFEKNKESEWFKNTLFVITADHTQKLESTEFNNFAGKYRVPLIFYHPSINLSHLSDNKVTQHADIMPSVLDFLDIKSERQLLYGASIFGKSKGRVINYISGRHMLYAPPHFTIFDGEKVNNYQYKDDKLLDTEISIEVLNELKAFIQYTNNGLKKNKLYY